MRKKAVRKREPVTVNGEPTWNGTVATQLELAQALNWYNVNCDEKDAAKYLGGISVSLAKDFLTVAWVTRMLARGCILPEVSKNTYFNRLARLNEVKKSYVEDSDESNVISIQERIKAKSEQIIGELEGFVDEYGIRGNAKEMKVYQWFIDNNVKSVHTGRIIEYFRERSKEILEVLQGKNSELKEGYSTCGKARLMNTLQCFANIIKDAEKLSSNTKGARKPRKKKPVSVERKVSKINYCLKDDNLKIQSIDPVRIPGAQQLWIYNTKTRKLGVYNSMDASGLDIKGTTLLNFSVDTSISKTLRKPETILSNVTNGGKVALRKIMDDIRAKPSKLNGRINKDTVLLRVS